jgi:hypothetical protein
MAKKKMLGSVDLFGLNAFGQNPGMHPIYGALIGGGAAAVGSFAASKSASLAGKKEWIGMATGFAASGALYASKKTRHAALGAAVGTFLASGLPLLFKAVTGQSSLGVAQLEYLNGLGVPQINYLNGAGLGLTSMSHLPDAQGTIPGVHGSFAGPQMGAPGASAPVDLLGAATAQSNQVSLLGGPAISGLSSAYGATLLGGGR